MVRILHKKQEKNNENGGIKMKFQKLGNTDIDVLWLHFRYPRGLGGGSVWTDGDSTVEDAKRPFDICHEHGVNYIDTAPVYGTGVSEELFGKALKGRRNDFVLQTKCLSELEK